MKEEILKNVEWLQKQASLIPSDAIRLAIEMQRNRIADEQVDKLDKISDKIHYLASRTN